MKEKGVSEVTNPDLVTSALPALKRAAEMARKIAIQTDTGIVVVREGKTVYVDAKTLREEAEANGEGARGSSG